MPKQNQCCCPVLISALKMEDLIAWKESQKIAQIWFNTRLIEARCELEKTRLERDLLKIDRIRNRRERK